MSCGLSNSRRQLPTIPDVGNGQANDNILLYRRSTSNDLSFTVYNHATAGAEITASGFSS